MPLSDPRRLANDKGSEDARNGQRDFYCPVSVYRATAFDGSDGNEWPFWPLYLESMTSTELLSIAGTGVYIAPMLGVMLTSTFWGRVGDKTGNKVMMIRALMGLALTQLGLAFANEVWLVLILRFCRVPVRVILRRLRPMVLQWCQRHGVRDFCLVTGVNQRRLFGRGDYRGAILDLLSFFWINVSAFIICTLCALIVLFILPADAPHEVSSTSAVHSKDKKRTQLESTMASLLAY